MYSADCINVGPPLELCLDLENVCNVGINYKTLNRPQVDGGRLQGVQSRNGGLIRCISSPKGDKPAMGLGP